MTAGDEGVYFLYIKRSVCILGGFRVCQHLRSLAPVMNDDDYDGQTIFEDLGGLKLLDICLTGEKKPRKNLTQETCPNRGSNPGPLRDRRVDYPLSTFLESHLRSKVSKCNKSICSREVFPFEFLIAFYNKYQNFVL